MMATVINIRANGGQLPEPKMTAKLIVLVAFDRDGEGVLQSAFEPREMPDERRAINTAREMASKHDGVIAWSRDANIAAGDYGPPVVLYQAGEVPDLD